MDPEFLQVINRELDRLQERVSNQRDQGADRTQIDQTVNAFETTWLERFVNEERAEARGARIGIEVAFDRQAEQQRLQAGLRDNARMPGLNRDGQVAYTDGSRHGLVPSLQDERNRASQIQADTSQAQTVIREDYTNMRYDFEKALQEIENGQPHNFSRSAMQPSAEQLRSRNDPPGPGGAPATWEELMAHRLQENQSQEAQRQQEQELTRQRGIER